MDISQLFKGQKLEIGCPNCSSTFAIDASEVFKRNNSITCVQCESEINLDNNDAIKEVEKKINDLKKLFR